MTNSIYIEKPEHTREGDYVYQATYVPEALTRHPVWIQAGDDDHAIDALVALKDGLKDIGVHANPDEIPVEDPGEYLDEEDDS